VTSPQNMAAWPNGLMLVALCALAGCATQPVVKAPAAKGQAASTPAAEPIDASYDWHGLVLMPFGTLLKSSPIALHEVLLFHDDAHAPELGKDCYTVDGRPPRLVDHEAETFLLCFSHDRLDHIEASVPMKAGEGPLVLARACALWLKNSAPPTGRSSCEGREGDVAFSAHLAAGVPSDASAGAAAGTAVDFQTQPCILSLVLSQVADGGISAIAPGH
jgi:hypothetical protein